MTKPTFHNYFQGALKVFWSHNMGETESLAELTFRQYSAAVK